MQKGLISMDYNQNNFYQQPTAPKKLNGFSIASMVCGIISLVCCCAGLGLPLGALAILFAILAYRKGKSMDSMSISGIATGIFGMIMGLVFIIYVLFSYISVWEDPYFQREMYESFEEIYGEDYADMMGELYGFDMDEIKEFDNEWD